MAPGVVDLLEMVEVADDERDGRAVDRQAVDDVGEPAFEAAAVEQARQRIGLRTGGDVPDHVEDEPGEQDERRGDEEDRAHRLRGHGVSGRQILPRRGAVAAEQDGEERLRQEMQGAEAEEGGEQRIDPAPAGRPGRRGVQHDVEADHLHQEIRPLIKEVAREAAARQARDQDGGNHRCRHGRDQNQARRRGLVAVGEADIKQQERGEERLVA